MERVKRQLPSAEEYKKRGLGRFILDRPTHPEYHVKAWPAPYGAPTLGEEAYYRLPHVSYNSVLVTVISNEWCEGGWWRLQNMLRYTEEQGYRVALEEVDDLSLMPTDAIGIMRACAAMLALDSGFEWCFMLDTDVHLKEDTLVNLLRRDTPVVFPFLNILEDHAPGAPISSPIIAESGHGLQTVVWAAMSCMLFNTKVFNCLDAYSWHGHDYHFAQQLAHYGHRIVMDTDVVVDVVRGPGRHGGKSWDELWAMLQAGYTRRQTQDRDRRPPPDFDPVFGKGSVDKSGTYWATDHWKYGDSAGLIHFSNED